MYDSDMFTVTPTSQKIELVAGETYTGSITVANPTNAVKDFAYSVSVAPYNVTGENYSADLETVSSRSNIINWISIPEPKGVLAPNEMREVKFTITVPEDAAGGGQYAAILVGSDAETAKKEGFAIQNIYEIASVIYADVEGDTVHEGEVLDNYIPGFSFVTPVKVSTTIRNDGNTHETAQVYIRIKNAVTGESIYPQGGESGGIEEVIMPETTRYIAQDIEVLAPLGVYNVTQAVTYLDETSIYKQTLIVCPLWFLLLMIVTISAIVASIIRAIIKHKRKAEKVF